MGYYTYYSGDVTITPPLTKPEYLRLLQVVEFWNSGDELKKATADVFDPQTPQLTARDEELAQLADIMSFNLEPHGIFCVEDRIKGYENETAFPVVAQWLEENGHQIDGSIAWDGDESGDSGTIYAATVDGKNRVEFVQDIHENPGPSWNKDAAAKPLKSGDLVPLLEIARVCLRDGLANTQQRELDLSDAELSRLRGVVEDHLNS